MKIEVHSAADFLMNLLRLKKEPLPIDNDKLQSFKGSLESVLVLHYSSHWYPDIPIKGSGYRCIRINGKIDPLIIQAGKAVGITPTVLRRMLPAELTLWIDPEEVAYRIGENGSICVLYDSQCRLSPSSDLDSTASSNVSGDEYIMERVGRYVDVDRTPVAPISANNSPTKPVLQEQMADPRRMNFVPPAQMPPNYQLHPQPPPPPPPHPQVFRYHRQAMNVNHSHHPAVQHPPQYMQQVQWDGFGNNNNKVNTFFFLLFRHLIARFYSGGPYKFHSMFENLRFENRFQDQKPISSNFVSSASTKCYAVAERERARRQRRRITKIRCPYLLVLDRLYSKNSVRARQNGGRRT